MAEGQTLCPIFYANKSKKDRGGGRNERGFLDFHPSMIEIFGILFRRDYLPPPEHRPTPSARGIPHLNTWCTREILYTCHIQWYD